MNDAPRNSDDAVHNQAAAFLTRRDAGWSPDEAAEFALWRAADPRHAAAVQRIESTQRLLARLPESPAAADLLAELDALTPPRRVVGFAPWLKAAGLAAAAGLAVAIWSVASRPDVSAADTHVTAVGESRTLALSDGSTLLLYGGSRIEVGFGPGERRVALQQGEVHFAVAKDPARPFVVAAGAIEVRAVGTAFNVRRASAAVEVVVTEGKVMVSRELSADAGPPVTDAVFLVAGQSLAIDATGTRPFQAAVVLSPESLREKLAWQSPRLEFSNTPLGEVVARFNRHSRIQLELGDAALAARPVGGTFNADNAEGLVNLLVATGDIAAERVSETRIVLRQKP